MFFYDPGFLLISVILMVLMGLASRNVKSTFQKYGNVPISRRMSGAQAARYILDQNGLSNVNVERVRGELTDHYDPTEKVLRLSESVYDSTSVSAVGVAAHEAGHALQDKGGYAMLRLRQGLYPIATVGSNLGMMLIMLGLFMAAIAGSGGIFFAVIGLLLYFGAVLMTLVTLPVEFNASNRALAALTNYGIVSSQEHDGTKKVLNAAAMTYVAAALGAVVQFAYLAMIILGGRE